MSGRPIDGFSRQANYQFCSICTAEFERAAAWLDAPSAGQFVRDKQFGEAARYALPTPAAADPHGPIAKGVR